MPPSLGAVYRPGSEDHRGAGRVGGGATGVNPGRTILGLVGAGRIAPLGLDPGDPGPTHGAAPPHTPAPRGVCPMGYAALLSYAYVSDVCGSRPRAKIPKPNNYSKPPGGRGWLTPGLTRPFLALHTGAGILCRSNARLFQYIPTPRTLATENAGVMRAAITREATLEQQRGQCRLRYLLRSRGRGQRR